MEEGVPAAMAVLADAADEFEALERIMAGWEEELRGSAGAECRMLGAALLAFRQARASRGAGARRAALQECRSLSRAAIPLALELAERLLAAELHCLSTLACGAVALADARAQCLVAVEELCTDGALHAILVQELGMGSTSSKLAAHIGVGAGRLARERELLHRFGRLACTAASARGAESMWQPGWLAAAQGLQRAAPGGALDTQHHLHLLPALWLGARLRFRGAQRLSLAIARRPDLAVLAACMHPAARLVRLELIGTGPAAPEQPAQPLGEPTAEFQSFPEFHSFPLEAGAPDGSAAGVPAQANVAASAAPAPADTSAADAAVDVATAPADAAAGERTAAAAAAAAPRDAAAQGPGAAAPAEGAAALAEGPAAGSREAQGSGTRPELPADSPGGAAASPSAASHSAASPSAASPLAGWDPAGAIGDAEVCALLGDLRRTEALQELCLHQVSIGGPAAQALADAARSLELRTLDLSGTALGDACLGAFEEAFRAKGGTAHLKALALRDDRLHLDEVGAAAVASLLGAGLERLDLGSNPLRAEGLERLAERCTRPCGLHALDLSGCDIGDGGAAALGTLMLEARLRKLVQLHLKACGMSDVGAVVLARGLAKTSIGVLDFGANKGEPCTPRGLVALADAAWATSWNFGSPPVLRHPLLERPPPEVEALARRVRLWNRLSTRGDAPARCGCLQLSGVAGGAGCFGHYSATVGPSYPLALLPVAAGFALGALGATACLKPPGLPLIPT